MTTGTPIILGVESSCDETGFGIVSDGVLLGQGLASSAVQHAEFGEVSLRFEQGERGLSVSLASPDPEFARAVEAASAPSPGRRGCMQPVSGSTRCGQHSSSNTSARTRG